MTETARCLLISIFHFYHSEPSEFYPDTYIYLKYNYFPRFFCVVWLWHKFRSIQCSWKCPVLLGLWDCSSKQKLCSSLCHLLIVQDLICNGWTTFAISEHDNDSDTLGCLEVPGSLRILQSKASQYEGYINLINLNLKNLLT